jgi:hypothetical protein
MAEPENHTLRLLREFREEFREFSTKTDRSFAQVQERLDGMHQAMLGESVFPPLSNALPLSNGAVDLGPLIFNSTPH